MTAFRARIRFRKDGDRRFLSHHDLMRLFERLLRRAGLPFRMTEGFHPMPRMQFASALSLGIIGQEEVLEADFTEELDPELLHARMAAQVPEGITILRVQAISTKLTGQPAEAHYFLPLPAASFPELDAKLAALLRQEEVWSQRLKPGELRRPTAEPEDEERLDHLPRNTPAPTGPGKRVNIRPFLVALSRDGQGLHMAFTVTPNGTARPEEVLRLLGLDDLLLSGDAVLERTRLILQDEIPSGEAAAAGGWATPIPAPAPPRTAVGLAHAAGVSSAPPPPRGDHPTSS
jgi:radical SAM-linked protein